MTKINCWNEYDSLKTVILGSVFENDKIPDTFNGVDQENFIKIIEESNKELKNIQTVLEQHGVKVLRPSQPQNYNGTIITNHEPLINMRDFHLVYGNLFFMTYGPYYERRFQHLWLEKIINDLILDDNLILNSNEINLDNGLDLEYIKFFDQIQNFYKTKNQTNYNIDDFSKKEFLRLFSNIIKNNNDYNNELNWFINHCLKYKNKNLLHTASILKHNNIAFISSYNGNDIGFKWINNWLRTINVNLQIIPYVGHIDASYNIFNKETILVKGKNNSTITDCFSNIISLDIESNPEPDDADYTNPTKWLSEYKKNFKGYPYFGSINISPEYTLLNFYDKNFYKKLKNIGITAEYVKWSNGIFWEGGLHCITLDIERRPE